LGVKARRLRGRPGLQALLWTSWSEAAADGLAERLRALFGAAPDFGQEGYQNSCPKSDGGGDKYQTDDDADAGANAPDPFP
jgi:hypothetical protein